MCTLGTRHHAGWLERESEGAREGRDGGREAICVFCCIGCSLHGNMVLPLQPPASSPHPPTSSSPTAHAPRHFAQFAVLRQHTRGQISLSLFLLLHESFHPTSAGRSSSHSALSGGVEEGGGEGWGWSGGVCFPFLPLTDSLPRSAVTLWLSFSLPPPKRIGATRSTAEEAQIQKGRIYYFFLYIYIYI